MRRPSRTFYIAIALLGSIFLVAAFLASCQPEEPIARDAGWPKVPYYVCINNESTDLAADAGFLVIDLSDSTNWPHSATNEIIVKNIELQGSLSGVHNWRASVGVISENDATDGTAVSIFEMHLENLTGMFAGEMFYPEHGLNLRVASGVTTYFTGTTVASTTWQNDTSITATVGTTGTGKVAAGDLVLFLDEKTDGSTAEFVLCVGYDTE